MTPGEKELYEKTISRLRRVGCRTREQEIIYMAEEIERYRAKIGYLETARAHEITGPATCFHTTTYTFAETPLPEEEKTRRARDEIATRLLRMLLTADLISFETRNHGTGYLQHTEHVGTICVVIPKKEGPGNG